MNRQGMMWPSGLMTVMTVVVLLAVAHDSAAQEPSAPAPAADDAGFGFGVKAGSALATLRSANRFDDFHRLAGLGVGAFLDGGQACRICPAVEVSVVRRGGTNHTTTGRADRWKFWTIQVPILARAGMSLGSRNAVGYVIAGPTIALRLQHTAALGSQDRDVSQDTRAWDFEALVGAGIEYRQFVAEVRYAHGLRDIASEGPGFFIRDTLKSRVIGVLIGYRLR